MREALTPRRVAALLKHRPAKRTTIHDDSAPGLALRLSPTAATFYLLDRKHWVRLGDALKLDLESARKAAKVQAGVLAQGRDPNAERRAERERRRAERAARRAATSGPTLLGLVRAAVAAREHRLSARTLRELGRILSKVLPASPLALRRAGEVNRAELRDWLVALGEEAPHTSDKVLAVLRQAYRWGLDEQAADSKCKVPSFEPGTPPTFVPFNLRGDPTRGLKPLISGQELIRSRSLVSAAADERQAFAEVVKWWEGVSTLAPEDAAFCKLIALTACRHTETRLASWSDFDLDSESPSWTIPAAHRKGGREGLRVPLVLLAVEVLRDLRARFPEDAQPFARVKPNIGERIASAVALSEHTTLHDVRRSVATGLARLGVSEADLDQVLGHARGRGGTSTALVHYLSSPRHEAHRVALERWARKVEDLLGLGERKVIAGRFA